LATPALAQQYPARPVRMIVAFAPGGPLDIHARIVGQKLSESWGQPVVIENRTGASGTIGADLVARAPADGYTMLANASVHVIVPSLVAKLPYDPIRDFTPVTVMGSAPLVLVVTPTLPARTVKELAALGKAHPGALTFASGGSGTATHLSGELLKSVLGIQMTHIPYKGTGPGLIDVMAGHVPMMFSSVTASMELVKSGRLRILAITSAKRYPQLPNVPTFAESGYQELVIGSWYAVWLPARAPETIVSKLNADIVRVLNLPEVRNRIVELGGEPVGNSPAEFDAFQKAEMARWAKVVKDSGAKAE
ncbi:MAG: Bug family tripartite tricarboxylate transporter substrate binding protein, partial [Pseudomonadota bacterium]